LSVIASHFDESSYHFYDDAPKKAGAKRARSHSNNAVSQSISIISQQILRNVNLLNRVKPQWRRFSTQIHVWRLFAKSKLPRHLLGYILFKIRNTFL